MTYYTKLKLTCPGSIFTDDTPAQSNVLDVASNSTLNYKSHYIFAEIYALLLTQFLSTDLTKLRQSCSKAVNARDSARSKGGVKFIRFYFLMMRRR
jgi:hypothetical protein